MLLSIIILNYKSKGLLKQCLKGILLLHLSFQYEIIVVDNASNDHCNKMIKEEFSQVKIILASFNRGYAAGNNLGMKIAQGKYVLILNPDIAVLKNSIEQLIKFMEQHSTAGMVGPKLINPNGSRQFSCFRFPRWYTPILRRTLLGRLPKA
ncbi:MAG: glycosyltransferase family 2 protein, partial [Candidatus Aenigmarchaeota archaeon]|nr:glycosyltransferase family 2 protein [Candidatus Aenigmarchaeota archaeon]